LEIGKISFQVLSLVGSVGSRQVFDGLYQIENVNLVSLFDFIEDLRQNVGRFFAHGSHLVVAKRDGYWDNFLNNHFPKKISKNPKFFAISFKK
jgi:hypothetical protein